MGAVIFWELHASFVRAMRCYLFAQMQQKGYSLLSRSLCSVYLFSTFSKFHGFHQWSIKLNHFGIRFKILVHLPINLEVSLSPQEETRLRPYNSFKYICKSASVFIKTSLTLLPWLGPTIPAASS